MMNSNELDKINKITRLRKALDNAKLEGWEVRKMPDGTLVLHAVGIISEEIFDELKKDSMDPNML